MQHHLHANHDHSGIKRFFKGVGAVARGLFKVGKAVVKGVIHLADGAIRTTVDIAGGRPLDAIKDGLTGVRTLGHDLAEVVRASHALAPKTIRAAMAQPDRVFDFDHSAEHAFPSENDHSRNAIVTAALQHAASAYTRNPDAKLALISGLREIFGQTSELKPVAQTEAVPARNEFTDLGHMRLFSI